MQCPVVSISLRCLRNFGRLGGLDGTLQWFLYCDDNVSPVASTGSSGVQIQPIDERIRELCEKLKLAQESEVEPLLCELRTALREHAQFVEYMTLRALNRSASSAKVDD
jgi:hypothetical protein